MLSIVEPVSHFRFGQTYDLSSVLWLGKFPQCKKIGFSISISPPLFFLIVFVCLPVFMLILPWLIICCRFYIKFHWWTQNEKKLGDFHPFPPLSANSTSLLLMYRTSQLLLIHQLSHLWNYSVVAWTVSLSLLVASSHARWQGTRGCSLNTPCKGQLERRTAGCRAHVHIVSESRGRTVLWSCDAENIGCFWDLPGEQKRTGEYRIYRQSTGTTGIIRVWFMIY